MALLASWLSISILLNLRLFEKTRSSIGMVCWFMASMSLLLHRESSRRVKSALMCFSTVASIGMGSIWTHLESSRSRSSLQNIRDIRKRESHCPILEKPQRGGLSTSFLNEARAYVLNSVEKEPDPKDLWFFIRNSAYMSEIREREDCSFFAEKLFSRGNYFHSPIWRTRRHGTFHRPMCGRNAIYFCITQHQSLSLYRCFQMCLVNITVPFCPILQLERGKIRSMWKGNYCLSGRERGV